MVSTISSTIPHDGVHFEKQYLEFLKKNSYPRLVRKEHEKIAEDIVLSKEQNQSLLMWALERRGVNRKIMIETICETAARKGSVRTLSPILRYLKMNSDRNMNYFVQHAFNKAVEAGQVKLLKSLEKQASTIFDEIEEGINKSCSFNIAVSYGQIEVLRWLMDGGVNYNRWSLECALRNKQCDAVRFLLNEGCRISETCPLEWALFYENDEMTKLLESCGF